MSCGSELRSAAGLFFWSSSGAGLLCCSSSWLGVGASATSVGVSLFIAVSAIMVSSVGVDVAGLSGVVGDGVVGCRMDAVPVGRAGAVVESVCVGNRR